MSLHDLHAVFVSTQNACKSIDACGNLSLSKEFKELYAGKIKNEQPFSRHNEAIWLANDVLELHSRGNRTVTYIPSMFFFVAQKLVPLYLELQAYRATLVRVLQQYSHTLDDTEEPNCVQYINAVTFLSDEEKHWLCKFVTDGNWWGKGRQIKRAQDFYESPLMQSASLTQETQSEVARITKQFAENPMLVSKLAVTKNNFLGEFPNVDRLTIALKAFARRRGAGESAAGDVRYWVYSPGENASAWTEIRKAGVIALSYQEVGDYSKLGDKDAIIAAFQAAMGDKKLHTHGARAVIDFRDVMKLGDIVFAKDGVDSFVGAGRVTGKFYYDETAAEYKNRRAIDWFAVENFDLSEGSVAQKTLTDITKSSDLVQKLCKAYGIEVVAVSASKDGPAGWASYDAWAKAARETFAKVDAGMLVAADFDYADFARKFVYNPTVANAYFKDHKEDDKREVGNFISQNRQTPKAASWYLEKANLPAVKGLGVGCALNFMMKVRPAEFATYSPMIDKALMSVGLLARPLPDDPTVESYEQSKSLQGQVLAKMHELNIGKAADDESAADYLTVNEFAWWLSDEKNQNLIKEKVMSAQLKPVDSKKTVINGSRTLSDAFKDDEMLKRLAAALRTKPFAILAGHSGTGKSQLVRRLAYMTCNNQKLVDEGKDKTAPGNYCMVQVKPNWHDSTDLLGYYSDLGTRHFVNTAFVQFLCKAYAYPETPFFLCLDEMNLAPVEQYFAEYLSAVESLEKKGPDWVSDSLVEVVKTGEKDENGNAKVDEEILGQIIAGAQSTEAADWIRKHGLTIPKNLFVVGTVNMDETTCQFSRKVLDRAMTLLMNEVKFADMGKTVDPSKEQLLDDAGLAFFMQGGRRGHVDATEAGLLDNLNKPLANTPFVVAYRFANEYALYEEALANLGGLAQLGESETDEEKIAEYWKKVSAHAVEALDHVVLMKLLPRIHGMKDVVKGIFEGRKIDEKDIPGLRDEVKADGLSAGMMTEILNRGDEYLTFWP